MKANNVDEKIKWIFQNIEIEPMTQKFVKLILRQKFV